MTLDKVMVEGISVDCILGCNEPERYKTQRINVHLTLHFDVSECGRTDALEHTVNYSLITKRVVQFCKEAQCYTIEALTAGVARECLFGSGCERVQRVTVRIEKPEALKLARWPAVEIERDRDFFLAEERVLGFSAIAPSSYASSASASSPMGAGAGAGANSTAEPPSAILPLQSGSGRRIVKAYLALGSNLGDRAGNISRALRLMQGVVAHGHQCALHGMAPDTFLRVKATSFLYETPSWPPKTDGSPSSSPYLNAACEVETNLTPTELLQHLKGNVEAGMGRPLPHGTLGAEWASACAHAVGTYVRFGPRIIDVDILLYGTCEVISVGREEDGAVEGGADPLFLRIPHPRLAERDFALGPLADVAPYAVHPTARKTVTALLRLLPTVKITRVLAFPAGVSIGENVGTVAESEEKAVIDDAGSSGGLVLPLGSRTAVMGILNVTPDSFSDGGELWDVSVCGVHTAAVVARARAMMDAGADILDVGGQSTRPGSVALTAEDEASRVVPAIHAMRAALGPRVAISVDTFYAHVAERAVHAGANCVNDVSGGTLEPAGRAHMFDTVARLGVPYVCMHTRGSPQTMTSLATYSTAGNSSAISADAARAEGLAVVEEVRSWLAEAAEGALAAGVLRWNLILDPGIGFAKKPVHSFSLLSPHGSLLSLRYPLLYGPSRKSFLGAATGKSDPADRVWATAAAVTAAVCAGADIVRVHDVGAMVDVARTADACFRGPFTG